VDFEHTEQERLFRAALREFVDSEVVPYALKWEEEERFPHEAWERIAELGLCGVSLPVEYGGGGEGKTLFCIATEELARGSAGLALAYLVGCGIGVDGICTHGTPEQKEMYVRRCASGELAFFALTEAHGGSDIAPMQVRYRENGSGFVLNGTKVFISNGEEATFGVVFATRDPSLRHKGISAFVVDKSTPGLLVGKKEQKTGQHCSSTNELVFNDCEIPREALLGAEGEGLSVALGSIARSRVAVAAQALGIATAAYDEAVRYSREREAFGKPLGRLQAIQFMLADMATELEVARLLTYRAAWSIDDGRSSIGESAMAKLYASEAAGRICHDAVQIFGGYGYIRETPVERYARDQRITEIYEGTSEMQRLAISRQVLRPK
jgi:alkylation response protein AidB-like acyl-CoA dehydrogenase